MTRTAPDAAARAEHSVLWRLEDGVAHVTLNRPSALNAMNAAMRGALIEAFRRAASEARAILIDAAPPPEGKPPAFCSGQDLGDIRQSNLRRTIEEEYAPMLEALAGAGIPSVAAVDGVAAGAGLHLALCADILIASEAARFAAPFARLGLIPAAGGSWLLPRALGPARARAFILTGEPITAADAAAWGLAWRVVPRDALTEEAGRLARRLAAGPTEAFRLAKEALRAGETADFAAHMQVEAALQEKAEATDDYKEGVAAFLEKRAPVFRGQ